MVISFFFICLHLGYEKIPLLEVILETYCLSYDCVGLSDMVNASEADSVIFSNGGPLLLCVSLHHIHSEPCASGICVFVSLMTPLITKANNKGCW